MRKMIKFPKIGQFRDVIKHINENCKIYEKDNNGEYFLKEISPLPILKFKGSVKSHGTNSGVTFCVNDNDLYAQSRENIISIDNDNAGFAFFVESNKEVFLDLFSKIDNKGFDYITIFGEWCGGNIQKNVALNQLEKMLLVFSVKLSSNDNNVSNIYLKDEDIINIKSENNRIYNILDFEIYEMDIDFKNPKMVQNKLIDITNEVEKLCPIGKHFGVEGIGEGVVWKYYTEDGSILQFKVKGDKHAGKSKVKKTQIVDIEKLNNVNDFIEYSVTEERLNQGIERIFTNKGEDIDIKKLGDFIQYVVRDILTEEVDTLSENNLEPKDVSKVISNNCRNWFLEKWNRV